MKKILPLLLLFALKINAQDKTFLEEEVSYWNVKDSVKIGGTLTIPKSQKIYTAVLLITGSGQQDRDETLLGHKPFKVIAAYLASRDIAVLRVDDRGNGGTTGKFNKATGEDFVKDIQAGVDYLSTRKEIKKIGLLGHSEGGGLAAAVASKSPKVAFVVSMAGVGVSGLEVMLKQNYEMFKLSKVDTIVIQSYLDQFYKPTCENVLRETDTKKMIDSTVMFMANFRKSVGDKAYKNLLPLPPYDTVVAKQIVSQFNGAWFRDFLKSNTTSYWQQTKCPVLALNGTKDIQVDAELNLKAIENSLKIAQNKQYKIVRMPELNHLFQKAKTGGVAEYSQKTDTPSKETLQIVGDWIKEIE
jgi:uncharacterized protein